MPARTCPTCGETFTANAIGRPKLFCSSECRREMWGIREELPGLVSELEETRRLAADNYGGRAAYWQWQAKALEGAIAESRMRLGRFLELAHSEGRGGPTRPQEAA
jgi:hypothetical protein